MVLVRQNGRLVNLTPREYVDYMKQKREEYREKQTTSTAGTSSGHSTSASSGSGVRSSSVPVQNQVQPPPFLTNRLSPIAVLLSGSKPSSQSGSSPQTLENDQTGELTKGQFVRRQIVDVLKGTRDFQRTQRILRADQVKVKSNQWYFIEKNGLKLRQPGVIVKAQLAILEKQNKKNFISFRKQQGQNIKTAVSMPSGTLFYKDAEGYVAASPEMREALSFYKSKGFRPKEGDVDFYKKPSAPSEIVKELYGDRPDLYVAYGARDLGIAAAVAGVKQLVTGEDSLGDLRESYSMDILKQTRGPNESVSSYWGRTLTSEDALWNLYVPVATLGISRYATPISSAVKGTRIGAKAVAIGSKNIGILKIGSFSRNVTVGKALSVGALEATAIYSGIVIGETAKNNPKDLPLVIGRTASGYIVMAGAVKGGQALAARRARLGPIIKTEVIYTKRPYIETISAQRYIDVFGKRIHFGKSVGAIKPTMMDFSRPAGNSVKTPYLSSPWEHPGTTLSKELTIAKWGNKIRLESVAAWRAPQTGIYWSTGKELVVQSSRAVNVIQKPGPLTVYGEEGPSEVFFKSWKHNMDYFIAKGMEWQPKTGIPMPGLRINPVKKPVVKTPKNPLEISFKPKPAPVVKTRLFIGDNDVLMVKKYGVTQKAGLMHQTGKIWRTGRELSINVNPKPILRKRPGTLSIYEQPLDFFSYLETGVLITDKNPLVKLRIARKSRIIRFKDIVKPVKPEGIIVDVGNGQQTILKPPVVKTKTQQKSIVSQVSQQMASAGLSHGGNNLISNRVFSQRPLSKAVSQSKTKTRLLQMNASASKSSKKSGSILLPVLMHGSKRMSASSFRSLQVQKLSLARITASAVRQGQSAMQGIVQKSLQLQSSKSRQARITLQQSESASIFKSIRRIDSSSLVKTRMVKQVTDKHSKKIEEIIKIPGRKNEEEKKQLSKKKKMGVSKTGYDVLVRDRHIVHGRETGGKRFIRLNKRPLLKREALALGGAATDNSAAATFKIVPSTGKRGRKVGGVGFPVGGFNQRKFSSRGDDRFIEKTAHRIDTRGEVRGISAKGWMANQMKRYKKQMKRGLRGNGRIYALITTFIAVYAYACIEPALKAIIQATVPGMDDVTATVISVIPIAIFIGIIWFGAILLSPASQQRTR